MSAIARTARAFALLSCAAGHTEVADAFPAGTGKKVVLITGANGGIGREIGRRVGYEQDSFALVSCRDIVLGREAVSDLRRTTAGWDGELLPLPLDLDDHESIGQAIDWVEDKHGRIDVLINNAAVCFDGPTLYGGVEHTTFEEQAT